MPDAADPHTFLTRYLNFDLNSLIPVLSSDSSYSLENGRTTYHNVPSSQFISKLLDDFRAKILNYSRLTPEIMDAEINNLYVELCNHFPEEAGDITSAFYNIVSNLSEAGVEVKLARFEPVTQLTPAPDVGAYALGYELHYDKDSNSSWNEPIAEPAKKTNKPSLRRMSLVILAIVLIGMLLVLAFY